MQITEPTADEVAALLAAHAHRHAEIVHLTVLGDRGAQVRLPFVLGNPTGACKMPGARSTTVWNSFVAAALMRQPLPEGESGAAQDVMLWPAPTTWAAWEERWPALAGQVWRAAKSKCGALVEAISDPAPDDERLPQPVKDALAAHPRAALRRFQMGKQSFLMLVDPPASAAWRIFTDSIRGGRDAAKAASEMAQACTRFLLDEKARTELVLLEALDRWPGIAIQACLTVSVLAGAAAQVESGE